MFIDKCKLTEFALVYSAYSNEWLFAEKFSTLEKKKLIRSFFAMFDIIPEKVEKIDV